VKKEIPCLDKHCVDFIRLSPFVVLASADAEHNMDASPRGGAPGFVKVSQSGELLVPEAPGNNRIDTLQNVFATRKLGLIFFIPGFNETLRVNGSASLSFDAADLEVCSPSLNEIEYRVISSPLPAPTCATKVSRWIRQARAE
jgi:uncharacterized protein